MHVPTALRGSLGRLNRYAMAQRTFGLTLLVGLDGRNEHLDDRKAIPPNLTGGDS